MVATYTYDGSDLDNVRSDSPEFTTRAEHGEVGGGRFTIDDTAGTQVIVGQMDFVATEDDCATPETFAGFIADRVYSRQNERQAARREIDVSVVDLNAVLGFRLIDGADGNRPAEDVDTRIAWLLASDYLSGLVIDNGRIASSGNGMDKADYRYQFPGDVIADCIVAAGGFDHFVADFGSGAELVFRDQNASTADSSTLRISNVINTGAPGVPVEDYWYDIDRRVWCGPHTFPAALLQPWRNGFVIVGVGIAGTLWQSDRYPLPNTIFIENGTQLSWVWQTSLLPDNEAMAMNAVVETSVAMQTAANAPITITALNENGTQLDQIILPVVGSAAIWGQFIWGNAPWGGSFLPFQQRRVNWQVPLVFKQMSVQQSGQSAFGMRLGNFYLKYQILGYSLVAAA